MKWHFLPCRILGEGAKPRRTCVHHLSPQLYSEGGSVRSRGEDFPPPAQHRFTLRPSVSSTASLGSGDLLAPRAVFRGRSTDKSYIIRSIHFTHVLSNSPGPGRSPRGVFITGMTRLAFRGLSLNSFNPPPPAPALGSRGIAASQRGGLALG